MRHFLVFGTHPRLSLAEFRALKSHLPAPAMTGSAIIVEDPEWDGTALMNRLGGTVKLGNVLHEMPTEELTAENLAEMIQTNPRGDRVVFGLTIYGGTPAFRKKEKALALGIKRALTSAGRSVRWVTGERDAPLSPAAVSKLRLTTEGYDIALLVHGQTVSIGLTADVQDADAWSLRDYGRPSRDDKNGMLPPKLARMMVNLAMIPDGGTLLDPFCGSGTVLMEAAFATNAAKLIGSDIEARQVASTEENLAWLFDKHLLRADDRERFSTFTSDVRNVGTHLHNTNIDRVVTEGTLGPPLTGHETKQTLEKNARDIENLWRDTLKALLPLLKKRGRIVGIWPSFKSSHGVARADLEQEIATNGDYALLNPLGDWDPSGDPLLYHRQGQHVMRRIVVLEKR